MVWCLVMYLGQAMKDVVQFERPHMPVVVRLQTKWAEEFGLPSTHTMMGLAVPCAAFYLTGEKFPLPASLPVLVTSAWVLLVSSSRMYLGMHSLADILAGLLLSALLMPGVLWLVNVSEEFLVVSPLAPVISLTASSLALVFFPSSPSHSWSASATTTVDVVACYQGVQLGQWSLFRLGLVHILHHSSLSHSFSWPDLSTSLLAISRVVTGAAVAVTVRCLVKPAVSSLSRHATNRRAEQNIIIASKVGVTGCVGYMYRFEMLLDIRCH